MINSRRAHILSHSAAVDVKFLQSYPKLLTRKRHLMLPLRSTVEVLYSVIMNLELLVSATAYDMRKSDVWRPWHTGHIYPKALCCIMEPVPPRRI